jgi:hypothetical protein
MNESMDALGALQSAAADVSRAWAHAGGAPPSGRVDADLAVMSDPGLLAINDSLSDLRRRVDALHAHVAAAIASRSTPDLGSAGLARKSGHRTPARLIAAATGGHPGDAHRLIQVGEATTGRVTFTGERAPARHAHVATALDRGVLAVGAAASITSLLDRLALRVEASLLQEAERTLVEQARTLSLPELNTVLRRAEATLDPHAIAAKVGELRHQRSLYIREDDAGMTSFVAHLDPESAAPIKAAIDSIVTGHLRATRGADRGQGALGVERTPGDAHSPGTGATTRSMAQLRADALADLCRHALACDQTAPSLVNTTVVVRIPLDALTSGSGMATIDGIAQPIDAATARRMAADAEIIPCVLGADSEILDLGRARRLFSRAQKLALVERDGGCAFCGAPPQWAEGHHIRWWDAHLGSTDLANLILLCTTCHHRIHADGWEIRIDPPPSGDPTGGTVWFIPPPEVDAGRTPRLGGRRRFDYRPAA